MSWKLTLPFSGTSALKPLTSREIRKHHQAREGKRVSCNIFVERIHPVLWKALATWGYLFPHPVDAASLPALTSKVAILQCIGLL
jgi:hypothetical protein